MWTPYHCYPLNIGIQEPKSICINIDSTSLAQCHQFFQLKDLSYLFFTTRPMQNSLKFMLRKCFLKNKFESWYLVIAKNIEKVAITTNVFCHPVFKNSLPMCYLFRRSDITKYILLLMC